jgi:predicted AAA+ superfamily ATPase
VLDDCVRIFKVEKTDEFKLIAYQLINNAGSIFELKNIGREVGLSFLTLEKYMEYLKEGYIAEVLYRHHKSLIKRGRMLKKIYTPCVNFVCALNHFSADHVSEVPQAFGKIIENAVYNILHQKYKGNKIDNTLSFWRQGEKEIDFLVNKKDDQLPIEVKFSNKIASKDAMFLADYAKKHKLNFGIVVTKNEINRKAIGGKTIYYVPYYLILLMI